MSDSQKSEGEKKKELPKPDKESTRDLQETVHTRTLRAPDKESERLLQAMKKSEKKDG